MIEGKSLELLRRARMRGNSTLPTQNPLVIVRPEFWIAAPAIPFKVPDNNHSLHCLEAVKNRIQAI